MRLVSYAQTLKRDFELTDNSLEKVFLFPHLVQLN